MKYFKLILLISILTISCKDEKVRLDDALLIGNWSSLKQETYQEYYFNGQNMYVYDPYSGNTLKYNYKIKNDSIFRYFIHPDLKNQEYEYYSSVVKHDSLRIELKTRVLNKIKNTITLEMYINNQVNKEDYYVSCLKRGKINPDSL